MSVEIPSEIPGLEVANAELDRLMAAEADTTSAGATAAGGDGKSATGAADKSTATEAGRAGQEEKIKSAQDQPPQKTDDTPADADKAKSEIRDPKAEGEKPADKADEKPAEKSRYEKARERQEKSWKELNAQKDALATEREQLKRQREEFEAERAKAERKFTPEQYDKAAEQFEREGKADLAEMARAKAEDLRKNPPKPDARAQEAARAEEAARKEWALKAGVDYPELAKDNSPLQVRVAQLMAEEPDFKAHPKGIYVAARIASLETAAAGVPTMQKELGQLRARVKELEAFNAPGGPGGATQLPGEKSFDQKSDGEQLAELTEQAQAMGPMR